jgi:hypothetical protein
MLPSQPLLLWLFDDNNNNGNNGFNIIKPLTVTTYIIIICEDSCIAQGISFPFISNEITISHDSDIGYYNSSYNEYKGFDYVFSLPTVRGSNHYPQDIERTAEKNVPQLRAGCSAAFSVSHLTGHTEAVIYVAEVIIDTNIIFKVCWCEIIYF